MKGCRERSSLPGHNKMRAGIPGFCFKGQKSPKLLVRRGTAFTERDAE